MDVSYTLSRLDGNWDLDYATQLFYSSSYIQDGPGLYVDDPNRTGHAHRQPDARRRRSSPATTFPFHTNLGGYLRVQSGASLGGARNTTRSTARDYEYLEKAGTRTLPTWTNFDLSALAGHSRSARPACGSRARLLNVFNTQPVLNVNTTRLRGSTPIPTSTPTSAQPFGDSSFAAYAPPPGLRALGDLQLLGGDLRRL